jgi:hypothetical protein
VYFLVGNDVGKDFGVPDYGSRGIITGRFYAKDMYQDRK